MATHATGTGKGGKTLMDRKLSANVRTLALKEIEKVLQSNSKNKADIKFKQELILRLSTTVLPRLTEVTGEDGAPITIQISEAIAKKNGLL